MSASSSTSLTMASAWSFWTAQCNGRFPAWNVEFIYVQIYVSYNLFGQSSKRAFGWLKMYRFFLIFPLLHVGIPTMNLAAQGSFVLYMNCVNFVVQFVDIFYVFDIARILPVFFSAFVCAKRYIWLADCLFILVFQWRSLLFLFTLNTLLFCSVFASHMVH